MNALGHRLTLSIAPLLLLALSACAGPGTDNTAEAVVPSQVQPATAEWRVIAGDPKGVVVTNGKVTRGFSRRSAAPLWEIAGEPTGVACDTSCPDSYVVLSGEGRLTRVRGSAVTTYRDLDSLPGEFRPLVAHDGSLVLSNTVQQAVRLFVWTDQGLGPPRDLGGGAATWRGDSSEGTLFLMNQTGMRGVPIRVARRPVLPITAVEMPHGLIAYDAQNLPKRISQAVYAALSTRLEYISESFTGWNGRWIGVSTYLSAGDQGSPSVPTAKIAAVDRNAIDVWHRIFDGQERVDVSPGGGEFLAVVGKSGLQVVEAATGETVAQFPDVQDGHYVSAGDLVTVTRSGKVEWVLSRRSPAGS